MGRTAAGGSVVDVLVDLRAPLVRGVDDEMRCDVGSTMARLCVRSHPRTAAASGWSSSWRRRDLAEDAQVTPVVLVLGKDDHGFRLHAVKQLVVSARSIASLSGRWR